jgi:hypothetical protein
VSLTIRPAYVRWPDYDRRLREVVGTMTEEQLAIQPSPDRWPLWATIGHVACQRVFGLCEVAGEPGAETTPFTNSAYDCPGDDDLEHVLDAEALVHALTTTFRIVETCLDGWTMEMLGEVVRLEDRVQTLGEIISRSFAHDVSHITELNETLGRAGLRQVDLWE